MFTRSTFGIARYIVTFGRYTKILPWKWSTKKKCLQLVSPIELKMWECNISMNILLRAFVILYTTCTISILEVSNLQRLLGIIIIISLSYTAGIMSGILTRGGRVGLYRLVNAFLDLNQRHMEFYKIKQSSIEKDPTKNLAMATIGIAFLFLFITGPATYFVIEEKWKLVWISWILVFPGSQIIYSVALVLVLVVDWVFVIAIVLGCHMYAHCVVHWMGQNVCRGAFTPPDTKEELRFLCRAHQVLHANVEAYIFYFMPAILIILHSVLIVVFYAFIEMYGIMDVSVFSLLGLVVGMVFPSLKITFAMANQMEEASKAYRRSFLTLDILHTKLDGKFFKSVQPIKWRIGPWMKIRRSMFPASVNLIISLVIDLVLL